ncbi:MAG: hypothetical protein LQ351_002291 [Letrouitia transgressa]|nr:MAG: hypothetical protein LQ351_002291 [Letrouitia transgressa]
MASIFRPLILRSPHSAPPSRLCTRCQLKAQPRSFFSTTSRPATRLRQTMFRWLNGPGAGLRDPLPGSTNYINAYDRDGRLIRLRKRAKDPAAADSSDASAQDPDTNPKPNPLDVNIADGGKSIPREQPDDLMPFPMNRKFRSLPVLSDELKDEIFRRVVEAEQSVRTVSADLGVEMRRVGAVVRLKSIERQWEAEGKRLATPYARAVMAMLPQTPYNQSSTGARAVHESINDLPVHSATTVQLFHPVAESRQFTRTDAGRAFSSNLLPAEKRIPHPEMVELTKCAMENRGRDDIVRSLREKLEKDEKDQLMREREEKERKERSIKKVRTERWEFRFEDVNAENAGRKGLGTRYGVPPQDRKRGQVKIPTRVD